MYVPKHFEENRDDEINRVIENFPLATLVVNSKNGLMANHLPLLINKSSNNKIELIGHIAKANSLYREIEDNHDVLVIFRSEDAYISPNWYPSRNKNREHVPTWNYQAVHFYGHISFSKEKKFLLKTLEKLTKVFEKNTYNKGDWNINNVSSSFMTAMLNEIVGFRIVVSRTIAKSKLSQNREKEDINNVYKELKNNGFEYIANSMKKL